MDLPTIAVKLRDYLFWFAPAYLAAIALGAAVEVAIRRWLLPPRFPSPSPFPSNPDFGPSRRSPSPPPGRRVRAADADADADADASVPPPAIEPGLFLDVWLQGQGMGRKGKRKQAGYARPSEVPLQLYVWASLTSHSASWVALLVAAQISWPLAILRLGLALVLASLLASIVPLLSPASQEVNLRLSTVGSSGHGQPPPPDYAPALAASPSPVSPVAQWWSLFQRRFTESVNTLLLAAALGALLFGLGPGLATTLRTVLTMPLSLVLGAAIGIAAPLAPARTRLCSPLYGSWGRIAARRWLSC